MPLFSNGFVRTCVLVRRGASPQADNLGRVDWGFMAQRRFFGGRPLRVYCHNLRRPKIGGETALSPRVGRFPTAASLARFNRPHRPAVFRTIRAIDSSGFSAVTPLTGTHASSFDSFAARTSGSLGSASIMKRTS